MFLSPVREEAVDGLAFDYDGTLAGFHPGIQNSIHQLLARGMIANVLATSRGRDEPVVYELGDYYAFSHLVLENGSVILERCASGWQEIQVAPEKRLKNSGDVECLYQALLEEVQTLEVNSLANVRLPGTMRKISTPGYGEWTLLEKKSRCFEIKGGEKECRMAAIARADTLCERLSLTLHRVRDENGITFGLGTKWAGLEIVRECVGVPSLQWMAVGDGLNDLSMLEKAHLPCCPANAHPLVKKRIETRQGWIAAAENACGVGEILKKLLSVQFKS